MQTRLDLDTVFVAIFLITAYLYPGSFEDTGTGVFIVECNLEFCPIVSDKRPNLTGCRIDQNPAHPGETLNDDTLSAALFDGLR